MRHIYLNLKRFDIVPELGGVNRIARPEEWGEAVVRMTREGLERYRGWDVEFVQYFPEAHLLPALTAGKDGMLRIGCQGVYRQDTEAGGNFGAFTTNRPAHAMAMLGCRDVLIGHCEERLDKAGVLAEAGVADPGAVNRILNREILAAQAAGMRVLYCIGETSEEQGAWRQVLEEQLEIGLRNADLDRVVIGYEPVWSIGPGKTPADGAYITKIARFVQNCTGGLDMVYGGGLKRDNAEMLAAIPEISGGLIALTRFQGEIGFYPAEYLEIIGLYLGR